ncbi:aromatic alcohol reductase [Marinomonas sp. UCMA 3892]|uniref:aromatic alcohol reductase n=1 Tax=unclassified Marinomonas TaxID=196814 RepID=UPI00146BD96C|nr:aromatic alcohol reductase [Marinomonas sp. UCMA 3892]NLV00955.1 aromatic alcohol reductase [Marinomonas sp. UCMA 3892]
MNHNLNVDVSKILVMGAGQLGLAVLNALQPRVSALGGDITVLVSPSSLENGATPVDESLRTFTAKGVKFKALDLSNISQEALVVFFSEFNTIINCTGFVAGLGTQTRITQAALEAGVARYFPWQFGVDYDVVGKGSGQPVFDEQYEVRSILRQQQSTEWVIVSTGMFTSFLFEPAFDVVNLEEGYINALGSWDNKVTVTAPEDIGKLTTEILLESPRIINDVVFVAGDTISYGDLADVVDSFSNKPCTRNVLSLDNLQTELTKNPDDQMLRYRAAFALGDGMWWNIEKTYNFKKGIETQDTEQWLNTHIG